MVDKDDLREQFTEAFEDAAYPVTTPMDLLPSLPDGPATTFESGEFSMTAMELNTEVSGAVNFPFQDVESLVEALIDGLESEGHI